MISLHSLKVRVVAGRQYSMDFNAIVVSANHASCLYTCLVRISSATLEAFCLRCLTCARVLPSGVRKTPSISCAVLGGRYFSRCNESLESQA